MSKPHVLVVTGGHHFEAEPFFAMFGNNEGITWEHARQPEAMERMFTSKEAARFDAYVLYDLPGTRFWPGGPEYEPAAPFVRDFRALLARGTGLVFLHHALFGWPLWEEYMDITGGRLLTQPRVFDGVEVPPSGWRTPVPHRLSVVTREHPVLAGIPDDFEIEDEVYLATGGWEDAVTPLLTTDYEMLGENFVVSDWPMGDWHHPPGTNLVAWTKSAGNSPVVAIEAGDGPSAYGNPHYRRLLTNAIRWVSSPEGRAWVAKTAGDD